MNSLHRWIVAAAAPSLLGLAACGAGAVKPPAFTPANQTTSVVAKNPNNPLVVDWPSADRGKLEARIGRGLVVVRYSDRSVEVLDRCAVATPYSYRPFTRKKDRETMRDSNDLRASFPLGSAAKLEGELRNGRELDVDMTLVGRWEADRTTIAREELQGFCDGATHIVSAMTVGAFTFSAGADSRAGAGAIVLGAGASGWSGSARSNLNEDGNEQTCAAATTTDRSPPEGCGAPIRLEVMSLTDAAKAPRCSKGTQWNGTECKSKGNGDLGLLGLLLLAL